MAKNIKILHSAIAPFRMTGSGHAAACPCEGSALGMLPHVLYDRGIFLPDSRAGWKPALESEAPEGELKSEIRKEVRESEAPEGELRSEIREEVLESEAPKGGERATAHGASRGNYA